MNLNWLNAAAKTAAKPAPAADLGFLPEWDLRDLYPSLDDPQVKRDLDRADAECAAFEESYRGKLAAITASSAAGRTLAAAVERYESIEELLGRLDAYAGLLYAGNTADPVRAKFYGDVRDRLTAASSHLLFFTLELNRIEDATLEPALSDARLARYRPWFEDIRKERPYQLENRVEPEVVEALVAAVRGAYPRLSHRYYALKAKWFGKTRLPHWDRNAPLPKVPTRTIDWAEAKRTVLDAYGRFAPEMAEIAGRF